MLPLSLLNNIDFTYKSEFDIDFMRLTLMKYAQQIECLCVWASVRRQEIVKREKDK